MKCLHCGYDMPDTAKFCKQCGYPAGWSPDNVQQVTSRIGADKKVLVIVCLICIALLLILFIAIYPRLNHDTKATAETKTTTKTVENP